jgi:hypothetical protein
MVRTRRSLRRDVSSVLALGLAVGEWHSSLLLLRAAGRVTAHTALPLWRTGCAAFPVSQPPCENVSCVSRPGLRGGRWFNSVVNSFCDNTDNTLLYGDVCVCPAAARLLSSLYSLFCAHVRGMSDGSARTSARSGRAHASAVRARTRGAPPTGHRTGTPRESMRSSRGPWIAI